MVQVYVTLQTEAASDCNVVLSLGTWPLAVIEKLTLRSFRENSAEDNIGSKKALTVSWLEDLLESYDHYQ
jgi:hypothetical protein